MRKGILTKKIAKGDATYFLTITQQKAVSDPKLKEVAQFVRQKVVSAEKIACQLKSGQSRVSAAKYMLTRNLYGNPGLSRTDTDVLP